MISRTVAGAAIVWATPVLTSLRTPAAAAGSPGPPKTTTIPTSCNPPCEGNACGVEPDLCVCGESVFPDFPCVFARTNEGACQCFLPLCGLGDACEVDSDCEDGFACVNVECCGEPVCAPLCGTPLPDERRAPPRYAWAHA
jgi:hypothetical protein